MSIACSASTAILTRQATRLVCLTGGRLAFAGAAGILTACCGWTVSDETIRLACEGQSGRIAEFNATPAAAAKFSQAAGEVEFQLDGTTVNTTEGWRDMKIGLFARREPGEPATAAEWDSRDLPVPTARVAFAAIEPIDDFAPRIGVWASRLGLTDTAAITTLGDGAPWIWNAAAEQLPGSGGVLDIYHAAGHISEAGQKLFGEKAAAAKTFLDEGRALLLSDGWAGLCDHIGATLTKCARAVRARGVGRADRLFRGAHRSAELRPSAAYRPVDRQRDGGGCGEEPDRPADETDRGAVGGRQRRCDGQPVQPQLQRSLGPRLGLTQLNARIRWRTRSKIDPILLPRGVG